MSKHTSPLCNDYYYSHSAYRSAILGNLQCCMNCTDETHITLHLFLPYNTDEFLVVVFFPLCLVQLFCFALTSIAFYQNFLVICLGFCIFLFAGIFLGYSGFDLSGPPYIRCKKLPKIDTQRHQLWRPIVNKRATDNRYL